MSLNAEGLCVSTCLSSRAFHQFPCSDALLLLLIFFFCSLTFSSPYIYFFLSHSLSSQWPHTGTAAQWPHIRLLVEGMHLCSLLSIAYLHIHKLQACMLKLHRCTFQRANCGLLFLAMHVAHIKGISRTKQTSNEYKK